MTRRRAAGRRWSLDGSAAWGKWRRRSRVERLLLVEAFLLLGVAWLLVQTVPFRWLTATLGKTMHESATTLSATDLELAGLTGAAVRAAANHTPWPSVCLPQAVAAQWMLRRRRIAATLYLGVAKAPTATPGLAAHAWLRCGDQILTGAAGRQQYTVVTTFA